MNDDTDVLVIGAGLAGLAAATVLEAAGLDWALLEASDGPGGRVRTDRVEGFALDRGFQVLLTAYPEARQVLDYDALDLHAFLPGVLVRVDGALHPVVDPVRMPARAYATLRAPVGGLGDKLRALRLRRRVRLEDPWAVSETTIGEDLAAHGFGEAMRERLLAPLLAGMLLDPGLEASNRMGRFVLRMLAEGHAALPAGGMQAIPEHLASRLPSERLCFGRAVAALSAREATLSDGDRIRGRRAVVVATDGPGAARLLDDVADPGSRGGATVYFAAERPPVTEPMLVLAGDGSGPIAHLGVPSQVAPGYAPDGAALVAASVLDCRGVDDRTLVDAVRTQLVDWFGPGVRTWRHLRTYRIAHARPEQAPPTLSSPSREVRLTHGRYVCGDHRATASIDGALLSGRQAGEAVVDDLGGPHGA